MESLKNKEVLLIGAGPMAINHALVLQGMNLKFIVVGRGEQSAQSFQEKTKFNVITGGIDKWLSENTIYPKYAIDFVGDLTAVAEKIVFEDIEEGVLAFRLSDYLRQAKGGNYPQFGKPLPKESVKGTGMFFSSNGDQRAENIWGKRARWVALQGVRDNKVVGVAMLNHPESLNYPTFWHVRAYGLMSGNPLGQGDFLRQSKYQDNPVLWLRLNLERGQTIHFRFRIIVYEGFRTPEQIEQKFKDFVK